MKTLLVVCNLISCLSVFAAERSRSEVSFENFQLTGELSHGHAAFVLTALATVEHPGHATLALLGGPVALTRLDPTQKWQLRESGGKFMAQFEHSGKIPIELGFEAAVQTSNGWNEVAFQVPPGTLQSIRLRGLPAEAQLEFQGAARPERHQSEFVSVLPGDGTVRFRWKEASPESEGKLFYAAEMLSQVALSPGLVRQTALFEFRVMQGELKTLNLLLRGPGEVTRVQGERVLAWNIEPIANSVERRLIVQFNQPQKSNFNLQVQTQTPLGVFPQIAEILRLQPEAATRFGGYVRVVNDGAVRLEVAQAAGLSQVSAEQFPESDLTRAALHGTGTQRFVYRFSGADFSLKVQADQILPELTAAEILAYHFGDNETAIEADFELDIREAPLRELTLNVPRGYAIARINAAGMSDYFLVDKDAQSPVELRLVFGQPASGRQLIALRLERNQPFTDPTWTLPRIDIPRAKSVHGHVAVAADAGIRLNADRSSGLTEIASAFFPRKLPGIQSAFRLNDPTWEAVLRVERLPQTVQADVLHLFSIGEGIAYGSSLITYTISGSPVSSFKIELSDEYFNVEFTGKDVRNWQKIPGGYQVQLHTPISGSYTLLASYERPFKSQGDTLTFTGGRPVDAQSEQGHTIVISAYQFQVSPVEVSPGLVPLEAGEIPSEYRLFFDAPTLAAYHYVRRPFNLKLALRPLAQGDSLSLVVDRACLTTKVSKEGQIVTDVRYFVKNRGNSRLRLRIPEATRLWSASVNGTSVVPVREGDLDLIPMPATSDADSVITLDIKLASTSSDPRRIRVVAPAVQAPVMLAEWKLIADTRQRLSFLAGSLAPANGVTDVSGFGQLARAFRGTDSARLASQAASLLTLLFGSLVALRWARGATFKLSGRHVAGLIAGGCCVLGAAVVLSNLVRFIEQNRAAIGPDLSFVAPVQQSASALTLDLANVPEGFSIVTLARECWPAILALPLWLLAARFRNPKLKALALSITCSFLGWALLRIENGAAAFLILIGLVALVAGVVPLLSQAWRLPPSRESTLSVKPGTSAASAAVILLIGLFYWLNQPSASARSIGAPAVSATMAQNVTQSITIDDKFVLASAKIRWRAERGERLPLLLAPAVITHLLYPEDLRLEPVQQAARTNSAPGELPADRELFARKGGLFEIQVQYQMEITNRQGEAGFYLPLQPGLINHLAMVLKGLDVDVVSPQAVSVQRELNGSNTVASLVLAPTGGAWVGWKPRSRDLAIEKPVFYAELTHLYVPTPGVVDGQQLVSVRLAQGELHGLVFDVPPGFTITDVLDPAHTRNGASIVSVWRFDPDARKLRVTLSPAQARPFSLLVKSQVATPSLPLELSMGLLSVPDAADQIGLVGLATGNDVQLDSVNADSLSAINLEDFPGDLLTNIQSQVLGATVRRAFRYSNAGAHLTFKASPVQPDVRVESQDTVSLGEDRTVLAANSVVTIARAGIFRLSFVLPTGYDVESVSGPALSHWTESRVETNRVITLHLNGKTEGQQQLAISLTGPGARPGAGWQVPQLLLREANKHTGTLLLVPEQGLRLQLAGSDGLSQLDPQKSGIKQKGVLAFRVLQPLRRLELNLERVDPWVQVTCLEQFSVGEAETKVAANLQYQIENTGLKSFHVLIPTNALSVRFQAEQLSDFSKIPGAGTNGLDSWEIKVNRRVIGTFLLHVFYSVPIAQNANALSVRGISAAGINLQRGFVTIQSGGRLQLRIDAAPATLQPAEWQSIPRALLQGLPAQAANFTFRLVEPDFELPLRLDHFQPAQLLPGRVSAVDLRSVISDDGVMLTQVTLNMYPGEKRLLRMTLPPEAQFWFAFVNQTGVWPWREQDQILIPLEQQALGNQLVPVEVFYTCKIGSPRRRALSLDLLAPKFDLPLENITWQVAMNEHWRVKSWGGTLQLQDEHIIPLNAVVDVESYLHGETAQGQARTKKAEDFLAAANSALQKGDPQQARRAFQSAYGLSTHDAAFNEDARVQLHNIKLQEALVGLNVRQAASSQDNAPLGGKLRELRDRNVIAYTQEDAKDIIDATSSDENTAFMKLAERLIQQQDAATSTPAAIHATVPEQGRILTFKRAVLVDPWSTLQINMSTATSEGGSSVLRGGILALSVLIFLALIQMGRRWTFNRTQPV
jgi:hypothetical protein